MVHLKNGPQKYVSKKESKVKESPYRCRSDCSLLVKRSAVKHQNINNVKSSKLTITGEKMKLQAEKNLMSRIYAPTSSQEHQWL